METFQSRREKRCRESTDLKLRAHAEGRSKLKGKREEGAEARRKEKRKTRRIELEHALLFSPSLARSSVIFVSFSPWPLPYRMMISTPWT